MAKERENQARHRVALPPTGNKQKHREDAGQEGDGDHARKVEHACKRLRAGHEEPNSQEKGDQHGADREEKAPAFANSDFPGTACDRVGSSPVSDPVGI